MKSEIVQLQREVRELKRQVAELKKDVATLTKGRRDSGSSDSGSYNPPQPAPVKDAYLEAVKAERKRRKSYVHGD